MPNTSVQAAGEAVPSVSDLETPIMNAIRMASILARLLDDTLASTDEQTYHITKTQAEDILFAACHTEDLLKTVCETWEALS